MCTTSVPDHEAESLPRSSGRRVKYERDGETIEGTLVAVTDDAVLIRRHSGGAAVACWAHGNFDLVALP
jgi:hypothetical protein